MYICIVADGHTDTTSQLLNWNYLREANKNTQIAHMQVFALLFSLFGSVPDFFINYFELDAQFSSFPVSNKANDCSFPMVPGDIC